MNSVRLASITPQRASVVAHCTAGFNSMYNNQIPNKVNRMLYHVLNRFFRTHASGPTVRTGGFISMVAMSTLHQLDSPVVDIHQQRSEQADAQVTQHHDDYDLDDRPSLVEGRAGNAEQVGVTDANRER